VTGVARLSNVDQPARALLRKADMTDTARMLSGAAKRGLEFLHSRMPGFSSSNGSSCCLRSTN
jgi:hypothetical protein